jgi:hypothetical protein
MMRTTFVVLCSSFILTHPHTILYDDAFFLACFDEIGFTSFVGVFMGTVGVVMLADENGNATSPANPFSAILEEMMNLGGFALGAGTIAVTASLAAIMSTADSLIIALSQVITVELVYPLRPAASTNEVAIIGKVVSLLSVVVALLVGIFWDEGITDLGAIQFSLSAQAVPAFLVGLFSYNKKTDIHPWCMATGALTATVYVFAFYFGYIKPNSDSLPINAGVVGFILQFVVAVLLEGIRRSIGGAEATRDQEAQTKKDDSGPQAGQQLLYTDRPAWDVPKLARFGQESLTPQLVWKSMEKVDEPLTNPWWCFMMFFIISIATPLTNELSPPMDTEDLTGSVFLYAPAVIRGLPWWAFKSIILSLVPTFLLLAAIFRMPDNFPTDEEKIVKEGIDPNLVEMTQEEMNKRTSYDATNELIMRRRSSISQSMRDLGLLGDGVEQTQFEPSPSQLALAELATKSSRRFSGLEPSMAMVKEDAQSSAEEEDQERAVSPEV